MDLEQSIIQNKVTSYRRNKRVCLSWNISLGYFVINAFRYSIMSRANVKATEKHVISRNSSFMFKCCGFASVSKPRQVYSGFARAFNILRIWIQWQNWRTSYFFTYRGLNQPSRITSFKTNNYYAFIAFVLCPKNIILAINYVTTFFKRRKTLPSISLGNFQSQG